jgi:pimeloyl-ACP methyl ester carboxylesterase
VVEVVEQEIESRGFRLSYLTWGAGAPLVLVPGQLQAAEDWVSAGYVDVLGDYRVMAVDPLGFGRSDKPHDPAAYLLADRATDIAAVLDAEDCGAASLWGYSFGGVQVEAFARLRPDRSRVVVVGGTVPGLNALDRRNIGEPEISTYDRGDWNALWSETFPFVRAEVRHAWEERNDLVAVAASVRGSWEPHAGEDRSLPTPLFCYVGTGDWFWEIAQAIVVDPGTSFVAIEGHNHAETFQNAAEIAPRVRRFMRSHRGKEQLPWAGLWRRGAL